MNRPDPAELRAAADHAATLIGNVAGTLALLFDELSADQSDPPQLIFDRWAHTVNWLKVRLEIEREALVEAMALEKAEP